MPYFTTAGKTEPAYLAYTVGWKIIVKIIVLLIIFIHAVNDLLISFAAQGGHNQGLGFPAGEQRRTMGSGKKCRFNGDIADISGTAAITADARF